MCEPIEHACTRRSPGRQLRPIGMRRVRRWASGLALCAAFGCGDAAAVSGTRDAGVEQTQARDGSAGDAAMSGRPDADSGQTADDADAAAPLDDTICPGAEDYGPGCCLGGVFCGVVLHDVCFPRMAIPLDTIYCDGGVPPQP